MGFRSYSRKCPESGLGRGPGVAREDPVRSCHMTLSRSSKRFLSHFVSLHGATRDCKGLKNAVACSAAMGCLSGPFPHEELIVFRALVCEWQPRDRPSTAFSIECDDAGSRFHQFFAKCHLSPSRGFADGAPRPDPRTRRTTFEEVPWTTTPRFFRTHSLRGFGESGITAENTASESTLKVGTGDAGKKRAGN
jgi:hypothetical protein